MFQFRKEKVYGLPYLECREDMIGEAGIDGNPVWEWEVWGSSLHEHRYHNQFTIQLPEIMQNYVKTGTEIHVQYEWQTKLYDILSNKKRRTWSTSNTEQMQNKNKKVKGQMQY